MTETELWNAYCETEKTDRDTPHTAWSFGGSPDELAKLVCDGIKTATCSRLDLYELDPQEPIPGEGDISIVLNAKNEAVCIIRNRKVTRTKFSLVSEEHAYKEGEGDRSLAYWREAHRKFFSEEGARYGVPFDETIDLLCEEFEVLFRA